VKATRKKEDGWKRMEKTEMRKEKEGDSKEDDEKYSS
jgi:hypothetical protein